MNYVNYELNPEERETLEAFENGELTPVNDAQHQLEIARQTAHNTLTKIERRQVVFEHGSSSMSSAGSA